MQKRKCPEDDVQRHLADYFLEFTAELIVWGSPKVIRERSQLKRCGNQPRILIMMDAILRAIREDLGHSNRGIERGDLIGLFLTDPERFRELIDVPGSS